ncbi:MAG: hypothetical protein ACK5DV_13785 [Planctomycetota bacterium]|jgi:carbon monoxide dehydrogenase subunit G
MGAKGDYSEQNWFQAYNCVDLTALAGVFNITSSGLESIVSISASQSVAIATDACRLGLVTGEGSGAVSLGASGPLASISLSTTGDGRRSSLMMDNENAILGTGLGSAASVLSLGMASALLKASGDGMEASVKVNPGQILLQVGGTMLSMTSSGITLACGEASYSLTTAGILELFTAMNSRTVSSTGHTIVGAETNQIISAETKMMVAASGITTTTATFINEADATTENEATGVTNTFDAEASSTAAMTTIE